LLPLALFIILYGVGGLVATAAGDAHRFYRDVRWLMPIGTMTLASTVLIYVSQRLGIVLDTIQPWSRSTPEEFAQFKRTAPISLTWEFWFTGPFGALALLLFAITDQAYPNQWNQGYSDPDYWRYWSIFIIPIAGYFIGGATAILLVGIAVVGRKMHNELALDERFILESGVAPLRPFNRLVWLGWGYFALPSMLLAAVAFTIGSQGEELGLVNFVPLAMLFTVFAVALGIPHIFINRILGKAKGRVMHDLRAALNAAATNAETAESTDVLRGIQRHSHLRYQLDRMAVAVPTLISFRYGVQIALNITDIFPANVARRVAFT